MMDNKLELDSLMFADLDILVSVKFNMDKGKKELLTLTIEVCLVLCSQLGD